MREIRLETNQEKAKQENENLLMLYAENEMILYNKLEQDTNLVSKTELKYEKLNNELNNIILKEVENKTKFEKTIKELSSNVEKINIETEEAIKIKLENESKSKEAQEVYENSLKETLELKKNIENLKREEVELKTNLQIEQSELQLKLKFLEVESENKLKHLEMIEAEKLKNMEMNKAANEELINKQKELLQQQQQHVSSIFLSLSLFGTYILP